MAALSLSGEQRRIVSFFIDNPPDDRLGLLAAVEYIKVISDFWADAIKGGALPTPKDARLVMRSSQVLADKADTMVEVPKFWEQAQAQLTKIHPSLIARGDT